jgi:hypothetical protein
VVYQGCNFIFHWCCVVNKIIILIDKTTPVKYKITTLIDKTPVKYKITILVDNTTPVEYKITLLIEKATPVK